MTDSLAARSVPSFLALATTAVALLSCDGNEAGERPPTLSIGGPSAAAGNFEAPSALPFGSVPIGGVVEAHLADLDGDAQRDLLVRTGSTVRVLLRTGAASFAELQGAVAPEVAAGALALVDADLDLDLDLVVGGAFGTRDVLLTNDGTARFAEGAARINAPTSLRNATAIAVADLDRDGRQDLVIARDLERVLLLLGDVQNGFSDASPQRLPADVVAATSIAIADLDSDLDLDLVVGTAPGTRMLVWDNDGNGFFRDVTAQRAPIDTIGALALATGDVDRDGDVDLALATSVGLRLFANDGAGVLRDATEAGIAGGPASARSVALADLDLDGDLDLVANGPAILVDDGAGVLTRDPARAVDTGSTLVVAGRLDGDDFVDLLSIDADEIQLLRSFDDGQFDAEPAAGLGSDLPTADATAIATGDLNADGDPDLVLAAGGAPRILLADDAGGYTDRPLAFQARTRTIALADVDGDGLTDVILDEEWLRGDGTGAFTVGGPVPGPALPNASAAADVDGDGQVDVVMASDSTNALLLGGAGGVFTDRSDLLPVREGAAAVLLSDLDRDGDLDLFLGGAPLAQGTPRVLRNDGDAGFADASAGLPAGTRTAYSVAAGDLDGDQDQDLVTGITTSADEGRVLQVLGGTGTTQLVLVATLEGSLGTASTTRAVGLTDVDADGRADVIAAIASGAPAAAPGQGVTIVAINDGALQFTVLPGELTGVDAAHGSPASLVVADLDLDADTDFVVGYRRLDPGGDATAQLGYALHRQLSNLTLPWRGLEWRLEIRADADRAQPFIAFGAARIAIPPFGIWWLDPASTFPLPLVSLVDGRGEYGLLIPDDGTLTGIGLHMQAFLSSNALTNHVVEPIR